jgi:large subunit ribosomal protein L15
MHIGQLKPRVKRKDTKRLGRGSGSGWGKTAGRGNKGAGSRSGKVTPYIGIRGGNLPFFRRIPKRGFNAFRPVEYQIVNLGDIQERAGSLQAINGQALVDIHLIKDADRPIKILAKNGLKLSLKATFTADKFSAKAKELIEKIGGKAEVLVKQTKIQTEK